MTTEELRQHYRMLYDYMAASKRPEYMKAFGRVMTEMFDWLSENKREAAEEWLMKLESIRWDNYLTKSEAEMLVADMQPKAPWNMEAWKNAMVAQELPLEENPCYNMYSLWVEMNKQYSDSARTIAAIMGRELGDIPTEEMVNATHLLATDLLKDEDGRYDIRRYFRL